jgi:polar amino acid transport system substrate-binding protein
MRAAASAFRRPMVPLVLACALAGLVGLSGLAWLEEQAESAGLPRPALLPLRSVMEIIAPPAALAQPNPPQPIPALPDKAAPGADTPAAPASAAPAPATPAPATDAPAHRSEPRTTPPPAHPRMRAGTGTDGDSAMIIATYDWPPYVERNLPHGGYVVQLIRAALASVGLAARFEFMPWARAMALLREGKVTAVAPAYKTADREIDCDLSTPFPGGPLVLFALAGKNRRWKNLRDLAGLRIGVVRGYAHTEAFDEASFLNKEPTNDETANLRKLQAGRIDAMAADRNVVRYRFRHDLSGDPATLEEYDPVLGERDLHVCFSRAWPGHSALRSAFDKGLATVREAGLVDALHRQMRRLADGQPAEQ